MVHDRIFTTISVLRNFPFYLQTFLFVCFVFILSSENASFKHVQRHLNFIIDPSLTKKPAQKNCQIRSLIVVTFRIQIYQETI